MPTSPYEGHPIQELYVLMTSPPRTLGAVQYPSRSGLAYSELIYCPYCGQVWARVYRRSAKDGHMFTWIGCALKCEECGDGSLIPMERRHNGRDAEASEATLPKDVIQRELMLIQGTKE